MLITELNNITQMQHQLRSKSQLTECLRNISYLNSKLLLAGNHINFSKTQSEIAKPSCQMFYTLMVNQENPQENQQYCQYLSLCLVRQCLCVFRLTPSELFVER